MSEDTVNGIILSAISKINGGSNIDRNKKITMRYFGFDGNGGCSMQDAGSDYELTRESVRQITNKLAVKIAEMIGDNRQPIIDAIRLIELSMPCSAKDAEEKLISNNLLSTKNAMTVEAVLNIAKILNVTTKFPTIIKHNRVKFIVASKQFELPQQIESLAISEISHNGAVSVDQLSKDIVGVAHTTKQSFIRAVIDTIDGATWTTSDKEIVFFMGRGRNRFLSRIEQIFYLFNSVPITNIRLGIERNWNKNKGDITAVLSENAMREVLLATNDYKINESGFVTKNSPSGEINNIKDFEYKIFNKIKSSPTGFCKEKELEDAFVQDKNDKWNFSVALNYCPFIIRIKRGEYALIGTTK
jgi:hypothetical protein